MPPPALSALPDRYRLVRELGRGGMATVYLADDTRHHRQVAIKVLRPELSAVIGGERFLREIELTAGLQHPHILPLFDSGEAGGLLFYVMPFVEGESLRDRLEREPRLALTDALAIAGDVAAALTWAHAHGVVHRDIKPENILLSGGEALVADFGIALALSNADAGRLTVTGLSLGTPAYMSPEQIAGEKHVDGRSDVYALACVLFEMLVGEPPFTGASAQSVLAQALVDAPRHPRTLRADVPPAVDAAITRALAKAPQDRFATPREFVEACAMPVAPAPSPRRTIAVGAVAALALAAVAGPLWRSSRAADARASLPAIAELAREGRFVEAYERAVRAERRIAGDSILAGILDEVSDLLTVTSQPSGASVWVQRMPAAGEAAPDSVLLGTTPIRARRLARAEYRLILHLPGRRSVERIASSELARSDSWPHEGRRLELTVPLPAPEEVPEDMIAVPGGTYAIVSPDLPIGLVAELRPYLLDRHEVTNAQFREFARSGGYATPRFWTGAAGVPPSQFVDRTGLAAPRAWRNQEPPAGQEDHPVSGVSWHEARAFCVSRGKRLPTLYEWEKAARDGVASVVGVLMPWGLMSAALTADRRANFGGSGTVPVHALPFGIGPYGAHAMAGNVKEWLANPVGDGFAVAGGSWQDPAYVFSELGALPGTTASPAVGFRCARTADPVGAPGDQGAGPIRIAAAPRAYRPVDAATHRTLQEFYRYDRRPPAPRGTSIVETPDWTRERFWIDGPGSDSVLVYLYLPRTAEPPFQTVVNVPSAAPFFFEPVWEGVESDLGPHIKAGRAVLAPVFAGMIERPLPPGAAPPVPSSVGFRDQLVRHATELRMAMDFLGTRAEIDTTRLAYLGTSWGAGSRLTFAGVDDRFRAIVLVGAGIDERVQPTLPEVAPFNFAPYLTPPKLMLNGRHDEEHPWTTRALPLWNLLRDPKELVLIDGVGHNPPLEYRVAPINAFLDRTLGPVRPRSSGREDAEPDERNT
jgi:eukaryotic-like serine/threonine-protein kinase